MVDDISNLIVILGGSGVHNLEGIEDAEWREINTQIPGASTRFTVGGTGLIHYKIREDGVVFIPRHGKDGSRFGPSVTQYEANIVAARMIADEKGSKYATILSTSACGSYQDTEHENPVLMGSLFIPEDYILHRDSTSNLWGRGIVLHANPKPPQSQRLVDLVYQTAAEHADKFNGVHKGVYVAIRGDSFGTEAEAQIRKGFATVVGMTAAQEALIALQLPHVNYACAAAIPVDYDLDASHHNMTVPTMLKVAQPEIMGAYMERLITRVKDAFVPDDMMQQLRGGLIVDRVYPDQSVCDILQYCTIPYLRDVAGPRLIALLDNVG